MRSTSSSEIFILAPVVELRGPGAFVVGDVLRGFERAVVFQVRGYASSAEGVVPDPRLDAGAARAPLDHAVGVLLPHCLAGERASLVGAVWNKGSSGSPAMPAAAM